MSEDIEQIITAYSGKTFSNSEDALDYWREALKEAYKAGQKEQIGAIDKQIIKECKGSKDFDGMIEELIKKKL